MKTLASVAVLILVACASNNPGMTSSSAKGGPDVTLRLAQVGGTGSDTFYFRGPVNVQYRLTINNPTSDPITMKQIDLQTLGSGAYSLRTGDTPITVTIPANSSVTIPLSAWGHAPGGFLRATEPVTLRGIVYFESPRGNFVKQFNEILQ